MPLRDATPEDLPAITAIYAHHVLTGTGTLETEPPGPEAMARRLAEVQRAGWCWLVAEEQGEVVGFAYFRALRPEPAYRHAAEDSIYVRQDVHGQGLGKSLVAALLERAEAAGFRQIFAIIGDAENVGSIGLHLSLGFRQVGIMRSAGLKFGRWLDVVTMQRSLGAGDRGLPD